MVKMSNCRVNYKVKSKSFPLSLYAVSLSHLPTQPAGGAGPAPGTEVLYTV